MKKTFEHFSPSDHSVQLRRGTTNGQLARLLDFGLENDLVALLPHLGHEGLAGHDDAGEADLDVLDLAKLLVDGLARDSKEAETVQDGLGKAAHLGELRVDVERVVIAAQAVNAGLLLGRLLLNDHVGRALGRRVGSRAGAAVLGLLGPAEAAGPPQEDAGLVVEDLLACLSVHRRHSVAEDGSVALVNHLEELAVRLQLGRGGDGVLLDLKVLLAVEEHHRVEVGHNLVHAEGHVGVELGDDAKCWQDLEVLGSLTIESL